MEFRSESAAIFIADSMWYSHLKASVTHKISCFDFKRLRQRNRPPHRCGRPRPHPQPNAQKMDPRALVSQTRSSRDCSAHTFANFGFKGTPEPAKLLVSLWFGSSLRYKLRIQANFRTATL